MTNAPITILKRPDIDHVMNDMAPQGQYARGVIDGTAREQELELAFSLSKWGLRELALARWRGSATQVPRPPRRAMMKTGDRT